MNDHKDHNEQQHTRHWEGSLRAGVTGEREHRHNRPLATEQRHGPQDGEGRNHAPGFPHLRHHGLPCGSHEERGPQDSAPQRPEHGGGRGGIGLRGRGRPQGEERGPQDSAPQRPEHDGGRGGIGLRGRGRPHDADGERGHGPGPRRGGGGGEFPNHDGHRRGGGRFGGPPGEGRERLERGMLRYVILDVLAQAPRHGYEIIKQIEEQTQGQYAPSPGTLYPTLQYLEDLDLVSANEGEGRKVYQITDTGRTELAERADSVNSFWDRFKEQELTASIQHEVEFLRDALDDLSRTVWNSLRIAMAGGDTKTVRNVRATIERCQNEIREIVTRGPETPPTGDQTA